MKIGIIKEGKFPPDKRVALTPKQCKQAMKNYPELEIIVQSSEIRTYSDQEYIAEGIIVQNDISECDVMVGVKEVNIEDLIANKKYLFFSHTYKMQPYNRDLLQAILDKKIQLIDYEVMTYNNVRVIAFGRYAGIVGVYNGLKGFGEKYKQNSMGPAHQCHNMKEMLEELKKLSFDPPIKILITGHGRVASGAVEVLDAAKIKKVSTDDYLNKDFNENVYAQLKVDSYCSRISDNKFDKKEFYADPSAYKSDFMNYAHVTDLYVACHYWDSRGPFIFTREDAKSDEFNIKMVADISCDIDGPIASTIRSSTIADPFYGYDPKSESEVDFYNEDSIGVMAVDNLPCELPRDASESFGESFLKHIIPALLENDPNGIIERASETDLEGNLSPYFEYLQEYLDE